jgi:hypothetical protein
MSFFLKEMIFLMIHEDELRSRQKLRFFMIFAFHGGTLQFFLFDSSFLPSRFIFLPFFFYKTKKTTKSQGKFSLAVLSHAWVVLRC